MQRISEGTVFNYLPVNIGDKLDGQRIGEAMRALYATGFFRDVELRRDGNILLVVVVERPSIAKFDIKGNKDIKTEDLQKSLRNVGLATGKIFDRSVLDEVKQYLTDQYFSRGKYAVRVDTKVTDLPGNKVDVTVDIKEGKRAKIEMINLVGDTKFKEKDVFSSFELHTPNWLSWYKQDDRYSRESLTGDLEKLRSFYMDRGYANFQIESTQVTIAPEKDDMYITININEGAVFKVSRDQAGRHHGGARVGAAQAGDVQTRRYLFAQGRHQQPAIDELPARRGRLCVRQDRPGSHRRQ